MVLRELSYFCENEKMQFSSLTLKKTTELQACRESFVQKILQHTVSTNIYERH
jgi:hypothetical protein